MYEVILYYYFNTIEDPERFAKQHKQYCKDLGIKGRIYISSEGINGTAAGTKEQMEQYKSDLRAIPGFENTEEGARNAIREVKSTYINFPLLLKISTRRLGNWKPFLVAGPSASLNLGSNQDSLDDNSSSTFRMKKWTYNYELGFGIDFYLEYFKFTPSIRGVFGLTDELVRDNDPNSIWTGNVEKMSTRGIFVNFTFE